ncbi:MAG: recombinase family protein [Chitinophagaceae bacterium]|nr:recombinase family protein [Chitinophagaceae bacterium]
MQTVVIYTRVSTDEQAEKGYSLADQENRLRKYCEAKNYEIAQHFQDDHSAKTFNRPEFQKFLEYVKKHKGLVKKLLIVKWDRFSRNMELSMNMISTLMRLGVSVEAIEQPLDESIPENLLMKAFYLAAPQVENARRSLNTFNGMRRAMKEGRYVSTAPYGFKNSRDNFNKPIIVHSEMAAPIRKAFELMATGMYPIEVLRKKLWKEGLKISRSNFYTVLTNPIYCGKIRIKAFQDEPEEVVKGIHEPIISEELFYDVQDVLAGRKKAKIKYAKVNETYPLRGHLICPRCGKVLTGSSAQGNGGKYYYYHCTQGCKERHKSDYVHSQFEKWLSSIKMEDSFAELYLAVMEDIFKLNEGDREKEIKKLEAKKAENASLLKRSALKLANDEIDKFVYHTVREKVNEENRKYDMQISDYKKLESGFSDYVKYGISLLTNLDTYYSASSLEGKQKMVGLIFPEKLRFSNSTFQTTNPNEVLTLLCSTGKGFSKKETGLSRRKSEKSCLVTPSGFKPETF